MYKLSNYVIQQSFFDAKDLSKKLLLFSTRTSSIKVLDYNTFNFLRSKNYNYIKPEVIDSLIRDKILVEINEDELDSILKENQKSATNAKELYLVIQPTAYCSFGCHYCGQLHIPKGLNESLQQKIIDRINHKLSKRKYSSIRIAWFGAEPLSGIDVLKKLSYKIQNIASNLNISYSAKMVTNGIKFTLPLAQDLFLNHKLDHVEITLDGISEYHDVRRHTKSGKATFDIIYSNLIQVSSDKSIKTRISIRSNVDERNKEGISPLIKKLAESKLQDRITLYFAQIHSWGNDAHKLSASKERFASWEVDWMIEMESYGFNVRLLNPRRKEVCMAISPYSELIDPNGGIFKCTEVSLVPTYEKEGRNIHQLGHINNNKQELQENTFGNFNEKEELKKYHCYECKIFPICGGSCPKEWKEGRIPCPSIKFNIEDRILLSYLKYIDNNRYMKVLKEGKINS